MRVVGVHDNIVGKRRKSPSSKEPLHHLLRVCRPFRLQWRQRLRWRRRGRGQLVVKLLVRLIDPVPNGDKVLPFESSSCIVVVVHCEDDASVLIPGGVRFVHLATNKERVVHVSAAGLGRPPILARGVRTVHSALRNQGLVRVVQRRVEPGRVHAIFRQYALPLAIGLCVRVYRVVRGVTAVTAESLERQVPDFQASTRLVL